MDRIWLSGYPAGVPAEIDPDVFASLPALYDDALARLGDGPAFTNRGRDLSRTELDRYSRALAAWLRGELGLAQGDRVAVMMPNLLQYPVTFLGILRAGLVAVNVNPLYTPRELGILLADSGARAIVICALCLPALRPVLEGSALEAVIVTDPRDFLVDQPPPAAIDLPRAHALTEVLARGAALPFEAPRLSGQDLAVLQYTGGTTAAAKGAMLSHRNLVANITQVRAIAQMEAMQVAVAVSPLPLYHIFAMTLMSVFYAIGTRNILIDNPRDVDGFIDAIAASRFNAIIGINTLYNALLRHPRFDGVDTGGLRLAIAGGAATQDAVAQHWHRRTGCPILEGYGMTETSPVLCVNPPAVTDRFDGSTGVPVPSLEITVRDDAGREVAPGEPGELWVRGPNVMSGYWLRPVETSVALTGDGWLKTGDIVTVDGGGRVRIVDRKKDLVLVSGFNVYPNEVEDVLASHPGVLEVVVIGVPSATSGEAVKAFVVRRDPGVTEAELIAHCAAQLTPYKVPRLIAFRDSLPRSPVGKLLRKELRAEALAPLATNT